ncbi:hypothetical protein [Ekhidna sp.]|uniref:hypothetical protein n=1 Tax=Ekhidna sp. TaxID=2608089 RepID=UPI003519433C
MDIFKSFKNSGFKKVDKGRVLREIPDYESMEPKEMAQALLSQMMHDELVEHKEELLAEIEGWINKMREKSWDDEKQREVRDFIYEMF